jgi:hypothetical protein
VFLRPKSLGKQKHDFFHEKNCNFFSRLSRLDINTVTSKTAIGAKIFRKKVAERFGGFKKSA